MEAKTETFALDSELLKYFEMFGEYKQLAVHYIWEDLWWQRKSGGAAWLEKLIRA